MSKKEEKQDTIFEKLNNIAKTLMDQVPNDTRAKADAFCKQVAEVVAVEILQSEKKVESAEKRAEAAEARISKDGETEHSEELFILKDENCAAGTWPTLFRLSDDGKPLFCIRFKKHPEQPVLCGAHCAGFKLLSNGNVEICNGSTRYIRR
jgi:arginine utilization protein RocB